MKKKLINSYTLFMSLFMFHLVWIFQGIDVFDHGFHLYSQTYPFEGVWDLPNMLALSNFFGSMWLKIVNTPSVLWARLGGVLIISANALISYKILSLYFDRKMVFFIVFVSALFITSRRMLILIHYYSFPALLLNIGLLSYSKMLTTDTSAKAYKIYSFFTGFLAPPIILGRISLLPVVFLPFLILFYYIVIEKDLRDFKSAILYVLAGFFSSVLAFGYFYSHMGFLDSYIQSVATQISPYVLGDSDMLEGVSGIGGQAKIYIFHYKLVLKYTIIASIGICFISFFKRRMGNKSGDIVLFVLLLAGFMASSFMYDEMNMFDYIDYRAQGTIKLVIGLILAIASAFFIHDKWKSKGLNLLVFSSIYIMMIHPLGSNCGLTKSVYGMWVALPLALLLTYKIFEETDKKWLKFNFSVNTTAIAFLLILSLLYHFTNVYSDNRNRFQLDTKFQFKALNNVYSHEKRVQPLDECLSKLNELTDKNDVVLMINEIPMLYFLTGTKPFFGPVCPFVEPIAKIKSMYEKSIALKRYPKLFIYSKTDTTSNDWPNDVVADEDDLPKLEYLKDKYINELGYELIWENSVFSIYSYPSHLASCFERNNRPHGLR